MELRWRHFFLGAVVLAASGQQPTVFKSTTNLVVLDVTVKDRSGKDITSLKKEDFTVMEDGKAQALTVFGLAVSLAGPGCCWLIGSSHTGAPS